MLCVAERGGFASTAGACPGDVVVQVGVAPIEGAAVLVDDDERKPTFGEGKPSDHASVIIALA
jgi:hypothetical protein